MVKKKVKAKKESVCDTYRRILGRPKLTRKEIKKMRQNLKLLAINICEHVWGKKFY